MARRYRFRFKRMDVYQAAVEHFAWTMDVVQRLPRGPFKVTDQVIGASLSMLGNVGEANGREKKPGEVEQHYRYAQGSTFESATHLDALSVMDVIDDDEYNAEEERLARIAAMLTRLMQRQRKLRREMRAKRRQDREARREREARERETRREPEEGQEPEVRPEPATHREGRLARGVWNAPETSGSPATSTLEPPRSGVRPAPQEPPQSTPGGAGSRRPRSGRT